MALIVAAVSLGMFLVLLPFAKLPLGRADWFIPINQSVLIVNDLVTATLLFGHLRLTRQPAILVLGAGYVFAAMMASVHMLSFPGVFAAGGLLGAGSQSTAYLFIFWHAGFPLAVIAYSRLRDRPNRLRRWWTSTWCGVAAVTLTVAALALLATAGNDLLPPVLDGNQYSSRFNLARYGQWVVTAVAIAVVWRQRSRSVLDLWLLVVLAAYFFEIGLVAIFNAGRYDVGFYAGRVYALLASLFVMIMLLTEQAKLYRELALAQDTARSEAELRESREVLRLAMEGGRMGAWSRDLLHRTSWWSPELEHIMGLAAGDLRHSTRRLVERIHPEDRELVQRAIDQAIQTSARFAVEFRLRHADGGWRWMDGRGSAVADGDGRPTKLFGIVVDITARKRAEESDRELEARFQRLADGMPQLAWMARPDGWVYWYNRRWYEYTGTTPQEMEGWGWQRVHDPAMLPSVLERWRLSIETGEPFEMVFPLRGGDGSMRPFLTRVSPLKDADGRVLHWFGTNTDIAAQRQAEEALRLADHRKDEFLATLAHELRNPLAPIRTAVELIARARPLPPAIERASEILDRQSRHLTRLVDDLLEVSRITQGKVALRQEPVSLVQSLQEAINAVRPQVDAARHELTVSLPGDPLIASADSTRITQVFVNLLNNAVKFTPPGGQIRVTATHQSGLALIRVTDTGIGIASEHIDGIFEMFAQVGPVMHRAHSGLGIGLALVRRLVTLHGGTVEARSAGPGRGSEFVVRLPLLPHMLETQNEPQCVPPRTTVSRRILVIDDNRDAASSLCTLLRAAGHDAREAHSGPDGLALAFEFDPDVVLLDLGMPEMNGLEVARALRNQANGSRMRIIAVTGWGQAHDRELTRAAGFDEHLTKPLEFEQLEALLWLRGPG